VSSAISYHEHACANRNKDHTLNSREKIIIWLPLQQVWLILEACANVDQIATVAEVDIHYRGDPGLRRRLHERRWLWSHPMAPRRGSVEGIAGTTVRGRRRGRSSKRELGRDGRAGWGCGYCKEGGREGCHEIAWEADGRLCRRGPMFISFFFFYFQSKYAILIYLYYKRAKELKNTYYLKMQTIARTNRKMRWAAWVTVG